MLSSDFNQKIVELYLSFKKNPKPNKQTPPPNNNKKGKKGRGRSN